MRVPLRSAFAVLALTVFGVACSSTSAPVPTNAALNPPGAVTLGSTAGQTYDLPSSSAGSGTVSYPSGSGTVTASDSASAPSGVPALPPQSVARSSASAARAASASTTNTPLIYLTYTAGAGGATLSGIPGVTVTFSAAPTGTLYEAYYNGTQWVTVSSPVNASGTSVTFPIITQNVTLPASGSLYVSIYEGVPMYTPTPSPSPSPTPTASPTPKPTASPSPTPTASPVPTATPPGATPTPTPTPTPVPTPTNVVANSNFASTSLGAYGSAVTSTGWTQCSIAYPNVPTASSAPAVQGPLPAGATAPVTPHPRPSYTPLANTTPAAAIEANGTTLTTPAPFPTTGTPVPVATPTPTVTTVQTAGGDANAAVFGQVFSNYNAGDYYYNGICQNVTIPTGASLTFNLFGMTNEGPTYVDFDVVLLDPTSGTWDTWLYDEDTESDTSFRQVSIPASALTSNVGSTYTLFMGMWTKSGSSKNQTTYYGYYFLDDVNLNGIPTASSKRKAAAAPVRRR